jgi:hypothetical protein
MLVALFFVVAGLAFLWMERRRILQDRADLYWDAPIDPTATLTSAQRSDKYSSYILEVIYSFVVLYSKEVNRSLWQYPLYFRMQLSRFKLPSLAVRLAPMIITSELASGKEVYNESKIRLCTDLTPNSVRFGKPLNLQYTNYFIGLITNQLTGQRIRSRREDSIRYDGFDFVIKDGVIYDLADSPCSNHIGISTLAFISNGYFIINTQTRASRQSPQLLAPSGSGSSDYNDWRTAHKSFLTEGMERELVEECTKLPVKPDHISEICRTRIIGFARMLHQGGKPEFFGVTRFNVSHDDLGLRRGELRFIANIESLKVPLTNCTQIVNQFRQFRNEHLRELSCPLYLNLIFLEDFIEQDPQAFIQFAFSD